MKHRGSWMSADFEFICDAACPLCASIRTQAKAEGATEAQAEIERLKRTCSTCGFEAPSPLGLTEPSTALHPSNHGCPAWESAREGGVTEEREACAKWHDTEAKNARGNAKATNMNFPTKTRDRLFAEAEAHERSAGVIRARGENNPEQIYCGHNMGGEGACTNVVPCPHHR